MDPIITLISAHPYGAAVMAVATLLATKWMHDLLGKLVESTANPYDDAAISALLWVADKLTHRKHKPGAKVNTERDLEKIAVKHPSVRAALVEEGLIDAHPMSWDGADD